MAASKNCFASDLRNFLEKISTFFWLSIAGYAIEKEIERFQGKNANHTKVLLFRDNDFIERGIFRSCLDKLNCNTLLSNGSW